MSAIGVLALGRSGLLLDAIRAVADDGRYRVVAIITDDASPEYDVGVDDFKGLAGDLGAELVVTRNVSDAMIDDLMQREDVQIGISANWRFLVPGAALERLVHGMLNLHLGRLPDYKGNATANWAIVAGEPEIYADVHRMVPELDAGDVLARARLPLTGSTYVGDVLGWTREQAPRLFLNAMQLAVEEPDTAVVPGSAAGSRCYPRVPQDGEVDWRAAAEVVARLVRATSHPYPGAFTHYRDRVLTIWRASVVRETPIFHAVPGQVLAIDETAGTVDVACGTGALRLEEVALDGEGGAAATLVRGIRARLGRRAV